MALVSMNFRLEAADGLGFEEYRICDQGIEVCKLRTSREGPSDLSWRRVTHQEIAGHVMANTAVAQWLKHRIGWRRLLRSCVDPESLQEFGITENTLDRYAA